MGFLDEIKYKYQNGNLAVKLIFINIAMFIAVVFLQSIVGIPVAERLGLSSEFVHLLRQPWSIFTYMFLHTDIWHLLFNMFMLYVLGDFFYRYFGDKAFVKFYFLGGIGGGILYLIFNAIFPQYSILMGASAAIYSVLFAMVAYQPELQVRLFFISQPIKLLHVAVGFIVLGFILSSDNLGGNISHVGGALFGYFYMKQFEKGNSLLRDFKKPLSKLGKKRSMRSSKNKDENVPRDDYDYADWKKDKENKTNKILEKISRSGYNSLTADEKEFLFKQGKGS
ncbi:MAG: rhomboid family intramembrane serine protease [Flavobacteriaceae bacterium]|nr:rhomboid family intramembrane serine protease [Flavobacteriaceae bacterium]